MNVVALLTGRGNNSLKDKNILDVLGHPVLYYPAKAAKDVEAITHWYCSSDDKKILDIAAQHGYKAIVRPAELAKPDSQHIDCIKHAIEVMKEEGVVPDVVIVLLANNVVVKSEWIADSIDILAKNAEISSVIPVYCDNDHHPLRAKKKNADGYLEMFIPHTGKVSTNRQDLEPAYFCAHNFWALRMNAIEDCDNGQQPWGFMGNKIWPYEVTESFDIHTEEDLLLAAEWIKKNG